MQEDKLKTVKVKEDTYAELSRFKGRLMDRNGRSHNYDEAIKELLKGSESPRSFFHINTFEDHVTLAAKGVPKLINVYFKADGTPYCDYDEKMSCPHVDFVLELAEVQDALKKKGVKPKKRLR